MTWLPSRPQTGLYGARSALLSGTATRYPLFLTSLPGREGNKPSGCVYRDVGQYHLRSLADTVNSAASKRAACRNAETLTVQQEGR
jgi:hypothetical protein